MSVPLCAQQEGFSKTLPGRWLFDSFEIDKTRLTSEAKKKIEIAEKQNEGMMVSLHEDKSYRIFHVARGHKNLIRSGKYKLTQNGTFLTIEGLSGKIESIDATVLRISNPDRPVMKFKKSI